MNWTPEFSQELIAKDEEAWKELVAFTVRCTLRYFSQAADAEDVAQDLIAGLNSGKLANVLVADSPIAFYRTSIRHACLNRLVTADRLAAAKAFPKDPDEITVERDKDKRPDLIYEAAELDSRFRRCRKRLGNRAGRVFDLSFVGHSHAEIADILGTTTDNVKSHLNAARNALRSCLERSAR